MATYRKRGDSWRVEICVNGKRASATHDTKAQAKSWAIDKESEIKNQLDDIPKHTLREALERYKDSVSVTKKGVRWETIRINKFIRTISFVDVYLMEVKPAYLAQWRDDALKTLQPSSVRREMNLLRAVLELAKKEWGWLRENPFNDVKKPSNPPSRDRLISVDEVQKITNALGYADGFNIKIETKQQQVAIAFLFALETAMRAGEIVSLTWDRVNFEAKFVSLIETKNGDSRKVPLSNRAIGLLEMLRHLDTVNVFTVDNESLSTLFRRARIKTGIEDLHFHDTRHQAITNLSKKLTVMQLARMVGHRDLKSLMIYYNETATELAGLLN